MDMGSSYGDFSFIRDSNNTFEFKFESEVELKLEFVFKLSLFVSVLLSILL